MLTPLFGPQGGAGPLGLEFKLLKNGFFEAPQTWQVSRMVLGANFGNTKFSHKTPTDPLTSPKRGKCYKTLILQGRNEGKIFFGGGELFY